MKYKETSEWQRVENWKWRRIIMRGSSVGNIFSGSAFTTRMPTKNKLPIYGDDKENK